MGMGDGEVKEEDAEGDEDDRQAGRQPGKVSFNWKQVKEVSRCSRPDLSPLQPLSRCVVAAVADAARRKS